MLWLDIRQIHKGTSKHRGKTATEIEIQIEQSNYVLVVRLWVDIKNIYVSG